jgi:hypothetical protein
MDIAMKWGLIFGIAGFLLAGFFGTFLGCCNFVVVLGLGALCGGVTASQVVHAFSQTPRSPMKEGAKAAALASAFMVVGDVIGRIIGAALSKESMKYIEEVLVEWEMISPGELMEPGAQAGYWIGSIVSAGCCCIVDVIFMIAGGALGAWFYERVWK